MYKALEGHIPAINIEHFLKSQRPKLTLRAKQYKDFVTKNIMTSLKTLYVTSQNALNLCLLKLKLILCEDRV